MSLSFTLAFLIYFIVREKAIIIFHILSLTEFEFCSLDKNFSFVLISNYKFI